MKKIILALFGLILVCGCTNINNSSIDELVEERMNVNSNIDNEYRTGYKYYLPKGLNIITQSDYNEKINSDRYTYYLYVDIVSYYNKVKQDYKPNNKAYYSKALEHNKKYGYLEINPVNDKYLVEIMYNYAKIEVIVKKEDLKITIVNAMSILNSIKYNNNIIKNVMGENVLHNKETEMNIFETKKTESNFIHYEEIYGQYEEETHDSDLID